MAYDGDYNPSRVVLTIGPPLVAGGLPAPPLPGIPAGVAFPLSIASGRGPDTHVTAARSTDTWSFTVGVDGNATHNRSNDKTGTIGLSLTHGSGFNTSISFLGNAQESELVPDFTVEVSITDFNTTPPSIMYGQNCKIKRPADFDRGATDGANQWDFMPTDLSMVHQGRLGG